MKYKVEHLEGSTYQIWKIKFPKDIITTDSPSYLRAYWEVVFQGTLPECEAWINLHEKGYME